jgi:hypothetical protein
MKSLHSQERSKSSLVAAILRNISSNSGSLRRARVTDYHPVGHERVFTRSSSDIAVERMVSRSPWCTPRLHRLFHCLHSCLALVWHIELRTNTHRRPCTAGHGRWPAGSNGSDNDCPPRKPTCGESDGHYGDARNARPASGANVCEFHPETRLVAAAVLRKSADWHGRMILAWLRLKLRDGHMHRMAVAELVSSMLLTASFTLRASRRNASALVDLRPFQRPAFRDSRVTQFLGNRSNIGGQFLLPRFLLSKPFLDNENQDAGGAGEAMNSS